MKIKHKYIDYFFTLFELIIVVSCIFNWFGTDLGFYRFMLGISALELAIYRLTDGVNRNE